MKIVKGILLSVCVLLAGVYSSCNKTNGDLPPEPIVSAYINVVNAGADTINVFQNGSRINNTTSFYPNGSAGYLEVAAGLQQYQIKKAGSPDVVASLPLTLDSARAYSFFIAGLSDDKTFLINDLVPNSAENVYIRYVNASPGGNFDVKIGSSFSAADIAFKGATAFIKVSSGKNTLNIYPAGTLTPVSTGTLTLEDGKVYTLFTKGAAGGTGNGAFGARLIINK